MKLNSNLIRPCGRLLAIAAAALIGLPSVAAAAENEPQHPAKPLLWKVEGNGLEKPSYLFGTIHLGDPVVTTLHPAAQKAFDESTVFHAEVPLDPKTQLEGMSVILRKDEKTLGESIGAELTGQLDKELKQIQASLDATPFQQFGTGFMAVMLPLIGEQMKGEKPLDIVLWERAEKAGKKTKGIQTVEKQLVGITALTEAEQTELLSSTLKGMREAREAGKSLFGDTRKAYLSGDPIQVQKVVEEMLTADCENEALRDKLLKSILSDRDVIMADYITEVLGKSPAATQFFAVGSGHYCSEVSVISYLKKAGFTVTKIDG